MTNNNYLVDAIIEISELRATNRALLAQLDEHAADFRDLAEARADVQRFEAALDASQRELAEARADVQRFEAALDASQRELAEAERKLAVSETLRAAASRSGNEVAKSTLDYYAMEKRKARTWEERALKAEAALDVSQRELAEARKERVDALNRLGAGQVEYDSLYASLLDCQTERDEAEQIAAACAEEVAEAEDDLDRQRRTILALVVAFRCAMLFVKTADMKWLRAAIKIERGRAQPDNA